jgi:hypothetical protein
MSSREIQAYNKSNNHKGDTEICHRSSTSHLEVYVSVEEPMKGEPLHISHFPPFSDHKDRARLLTQSRGNTNFLGQPQTFGCSKATQSSKSNKYESYQPSEEWGALEMENQLTNTLQAPTLNPSLNPQQISPNQDLGE